MRKLTIEQSEDYADEILGDFFDYEVTDLEVLQKWYEIKEIAESEGNQFHAATLAYMMAVAEEIREDPESFIKFIAIQA